MRRLKRSTRRLVLTVLALLLVGGIYTVLFPSMGSSKGPALTSYSVFPILKPTDRITIVAPHLDDETLGLGGLIAQARHQGIAVSIIFMTNGDDNPIGADLLFKTGYPTPDQLIQSGVARQQESIKALHTLGVESDSLYFLGLPDRGLSALLSARYQTLPFRAPGTLQSHSTYQLSFIPQLAYTGQATRSALVKAINQTEPTLLFTTLPEDLHRDHSATATFISQIQSQLQTKPKLYYFLIHYRQFPRPKGTVKDQPLLPPLKLANRHWEVIFLDANARSLKQTAVSEYVSQLRVVFLRNLMLSLQNRRNELVLPQR